MRYFSKTYLVTSPIYLKKTLLLWFPGYHYLVRDYKNLPPEAQDSSIPYEEGNISATSLSKILKDLQFIDFSSLGIARAIAIIYRFSIILISAA